METAKSRPASFGKRHGMPEFGKEKADAGSQIESGEEDRGEKLYSIQYLRAFAAYLVVVFHVYASLNSETGDGAVFAIGSIGVDIFFVLSGFLMAMIVAEHRDVDGQFLLRRFIRIAPLYYVMTFALIAVAVVAPLLLNADKLDAGHIITSFLFLPYPQEDGSVVPILGLGWTLNYEMFFYCLVAATTYVLGDKTLRSTVIALFLLVSAGQLADFGTVWRFYTDPIILEFAAGILIYRYIYLDARKRNSVIFTLTLFGGLMAMALDPYGFPGNHRLFQWGFPAILIVTGGIFVLNFRAKWLKQLGDWSYSTYLIHVYIVQLAVKSLASADLATYVSPAVLAIALLPVIIAASAYMYRYMEMPMMRRLERLAGMDTRRHKPIVPPPLAPEEVPPLVVPKRQ